MRPTDTLTLRLSIIIPIYNEAESLLELHAELIKVLKQLEITFEIIFVDDGSSDNTLEMASKISSFKLIHFNENYGQTAAIAAGVNASKGEIIIIMDGDLENSPYDIPQLLKKIDEGFDVVSGWRKSRWRDNFFSRRLPSVMANKLISFVTGTKLHDHGCTLKAYRKKYIESIYFFGDMHRMLATCVFNSGGKITEIPVSFIPRKHGYSKYGLSRTFRVLLDIFSFYFFKKYKHRPMHFFGWFGFLSLFAGLFTFILMVVFKLWDGKSFISTPLPILTVFFVVIGVQFILMGLTAEIVVRTQYETQNKTSYVIDKIIEQ